MAMFAAAMPRVHLLVAAEGFFDSGRRSVGTSVRVVRIWESRRDSFGTILR